MRSKRVNYCDPETVLRVQTTRELCGRADALMFRLEVVWRNLPKEFEGRIPIPPDIQRLAQRVAQTGFTREALVRMMRAL